MRCLLLVGLLLLNGCAGLLASLSSPPLTRPPAIDATAEAIEDVLIQDQRNFNATAERIQEGLPEREVLTQYMETMKAIDLRNCPSDFREVFARHTAAWDEAYRFDMSRSQTKRWFSVGMAVLRKDAATALEKTFTPDAAEHARLKEGINHTWNEVEVLAAKYGARTASQGWK